MEAIKMKTHVGDDGVMKLEVPTSFSNSDLEVIVVVHSQTPQQDGFDRAEWIAFVETTAGSLVDDPIVRGDQGTLEIRDEIL